MSTIVERTSSKAALRERRTPEFSRYDRRIVRDICVERSRAATLATEWVALEGTRDPRSRLKADKARRELKGVLRHYTQLLLELGEPRATALALVSELAAEVAPHSRGDMSEDDLRQELVEYTSDVMPGRAVTSVSGS
jgi:hypothetical protein